MAIIKASCPECGDVEMSIGEVQVALCTTTDHGSYAFRCPGCRMAVSKPIDGDVVDVLVASGARLSVWELPAELSEAHEGGPITHDDLLAFHFELDRDDWMARLRSAASGRGVGSASVEQP